MKNLTTITAVASTKRVESAKVLVGDCSHVSKFPFQKVAVMVKRQVLKYFLGEWIELTVYVFEDEKIGLN